MIARSMCLNKKFRLFRERCIFVFRISIRTIWFNFYYLPLNQAIHLPFLISRKVKFRRPYGQILLSDNCSFASIRIGFGDVGIIDYKYTRTIWDVSGKVFFKGKATLGYGTSIAVGEDGELFFGENFILTARSSIIAMKQVSFGDDCQLSWDVLIMDSDLHNITDTEQNIINPAKPVIIGNHVWIGCRCLILKGVEIPNDCVIGANTHIHKSLPQSHCVYAGNPVRKIANDISWNL